MQVLDTNPIFTIAFPSVAVAYWVILDTVQNGWVYVESTEGLSVYHSIATYIISSNETEKLILIGKRELFLRDICGVLGSKIYKLIWMNWGKPRKGQNIWVVRDSSLAERQCEYLPNKRVQSWRYMNLLTEDERCRNMFRKGKERKNMLWVPTRFFIHHRPLRYEGLLNNRL